MQNHLPDLLQFILDSKIDTTDPISHRLPLEQAAEGCKTFKTHQNEWIKVVRLPRCGRPRKSPAPARPPDQRASQTS